MDRFALSYGEIAGGILALSAALHRRLGASDFGVKLSAALRHPRNSRKRKEYRAIVRTRLEQQRHDAHGAKLPVPLQRLPDLSARLDVDAPSNATSQSRIQRWVKWLRRGSPRDTPALMTKLSLIALLRESAIRLRQNGWGQTPRGRLLIDAFLWPSDYAKLKAIYCKFYGTPLRLTRPVLFSDSLPRKLFNRTALQTIFADKIAVRDFVRSKVGESVLTQLYWTGTDLQDLKPKLLPNEFVLKANHGSGMSLIAHDRDTVDWNLFRETAKEWLALDYSEGWAEWQYRWIPRALLIEEYLPGNDGEPPLDYKFFCFGGRAKLVQIDFDRFTNHKRTFVDRSFKVVDFSLVYPRYSGSLLARPKHFDEMIAIAEVLAKDQPFLRVDLYDVGRPIFGELTLHPEAGLARFDPPEFDHYLGDWLA